MLASGALQALHEKGIRVPDDMSIIGYDDTLAEILTPPLTCIAQPIAELGRNAVTLALVHRFPISNQIMRQGRACMTKCERRDRD